MKNFNLKTSILLILCLVFITAVYADDFPPRPKPPRLVNDFTGTLNKNEIGKLERKLVNFNDTTSTQIVVVLVKSFHGYDKAQYADRLGELWGVGQKGKENGIVVLVKPKTRTSRGEAFIATGYGLEGAVPDAVAKRIVESEMIPAFKKNMYYAGLDNATKTLMKLTAGEFTADQYLKRTVRSGRSPIGFIIPLIIFIIILIRIFSSRKRMSQYSGRRGSSLPFWTALFLANNLGGSHKGTWNNFSSGGGSFGGFSGGGSFGGFGGGSFGGGGAGGSW